MPLVTSEEMLSKAQEGGYAVGAFNAENMEMVKGDHPGSRRTQSTGYDPDNTIYHQIRNSRDLRSDRCSGGCRKHLFRYAFIWIMAAALNLPCRRCMQGILLS